MVVQKMFKYRIYPSSKQSKRIINNFKICKSAYNMLLATSIDAYKFGGVSLTKFDFDSIIKGYSTNVHSQVMQNVSDRVHKAFQNFFRRVKDKSCKEKGFPRFKSRIQSITFPQSGFKLLSDKRINLSKIGNIPIILHRVPKGKVKTLTIKVNKANQWFAVFSCEVDTKATVSRHPVDSKVGIDVGIENFATLSNGEVIANPRYLVKAEERLKLLHRRLSRKKKGSANRRKAKFLLARQYLKVDNQRADFLHKLSHRLAKSYSFIAVEELNVKGMTQNCLWAKHINDASWGTFIRFLKYKAVTGGGSVVENPKTRGSSHRCSQCGAWNEMTLSMRTFNCSSCGFVCHRDHNASINHLNDTVGLTGISKPVEIPPLQQKSSVASGIIEAGTICDKV